MGICARSWAGGGQEAVVCQSWVLGPVRVRRVSGRAAWHEESEPEGAEEDGSHGEYRTQKGSLLSGRPGVGRRRPGRVRRVSVCGAAQVRCPNPGKLGRVQGAVQPRESV